MFAAFLGLKLYESSSIGALDAVVSESEMESVQGWMERKNLPALLNRKAAVDTYFLLDVLLRSTGDSVSVDRVKVVLNTVFNGATGVSKHKLCCIHPCKSSYQRCLDVLGTLNNTVIKVDEARIIGMQGWVAEEQLRLSKLLNIEEHLLEGGNGRLEDIVSFSDFKVKFVGSLDVELEQDIDTALELYTAILDASEPCMTMTVFGIRNALEDKELMSWRPRPRSTELEDMKTNVEALWKLLEDSWNPIKGECNRLIAMLEEKVVIAKTEREREGDRGYVDVDSLLVQVHESVEMFRDEFHRLSSVSVSIDQVDSCWGLLRGFFSAVQRVRVYLGEETSHLLDCWDLAQMN